MGVDGIGAGLDPNKWPDSLATNLGYMGKQGYKLLLDFENHLWLQDFDSYTIAGAGATARCCTTTNSLVLTRVGADLTFAFDKFCVDVGASTGTQTFIFKVIQSSVTTNGCQWGLNAHTDVDNRIHFQTDTNLIRLVARAAATSTSETASIAGKSGVDLWFKLVIVDNTSVDGYWSEDGITYTQIGSQITTNIPTLSGVKYEWRMTGAMSTQLKMVSLE